jgi:hypothetical protein
LQKIIVILLLATFSAGCSVTRNISNRDPEISKELISDNILESVKNQNITNTNFFIQKAEIEVITENGKEKLIGSVKFENPDKYLISIRNRSGIEGARIYISEDSILFNDRINRKMYYGSSVYLKRKYGLTTNFLPLIFGDIVLEKNYRESKEKCSADRIITDCLVQGIILNYNISCKNRKSISVSQLNSFVQRGIEFKYDNFIKSGNIIIPIKIELKEAQYNIAIKINIVKIELPWNGKIEFVPGRNYEIIELL